MTILTPTTFLFVPAITIERVAKAFERGAEAVIVDLEDAVSEDVKQQSRQNVIDYANAADSQPIWVRVNGSQSNWQAKDLDTLKALPNIAGIVLPKVEKATDIESVRHALGKPIIALIETPLGMANVADIAASHGLTALSYGFLDICEQLGVNANSEAGQALANQLRYQLLLHSKINGLTPPIECVYPPFNDYEGLTKRVRWWADMGFSGMLCIHPNQVSVVHEHVKPTPAQLDFAKQVVNTWQTTGKAAFAIDGEMVDTPVIKQAERLLQWHNNVPTQDSHTVNTGMSHVNKID